MVYNRYEMIMRKSKAGEGSYDYNIGRSRDVYEFCTRILGMQEYPEEHFIVIGVNSKGSIVGFSEVSKGDLDSTAASPREVFRPVIGGMPAACIVCAHNHPSGKSTPSSEDVQTTERLIQAGKILGIPIIDHIVIGDGEYCSMKECGFMND